MVGALYFNRDLYVVQNNLIDKFSNILPKIESESEIYFEHFSMDGLDEMHHYSIDERLYEFFEFAPFKELDDTKAYIEKALKRMFGKINRKALSLKAQSL